VPWQATELRFDLVSAVDELAAQLQQEFDFRREAETMDLIHARLKAGIRVRVYGVGLIPYPGANLREALLAREAEAHMRQDVVCTEMERFLH